MKPLHSAEIITTTVGIVLLLMVGNTSSNLESSNIAIAAWPALLAVLILLTSALLSSHQLRQQKKHAQQLLLSTQLLDQSLSKEMGSEPLSHQKVLINWPRHLPNFYGQLARAIETLFNDHEKIKAHQAEASERLKTILNCAADAIFTVDHEGRIVSFNRAAEKMFDYNTEALISQKGSILLPPEHRHAFEAYLHERVLTGTSGFYGRGREIKGCTRSGKRIPVHMSMSSIETPNGPQFTCIMRDISQQKRSEQSLIKAKENAERNANYKSEFLACMSHEIRTPMNGVLGMLELITKSNIDEHQQQLVNIAQSSAQSLLSLINDILDFSKIEAGRLELESITFDLHQHMNELVQLMAYRAQEKGLELILDMVDIPEQSVVGDPNRLRQIFVNLIGNAIKFTEKGEIIVTLKSQKLVNADECSLEASVSDTGIGIPLDRQHTLFDSFTQVDASTTRKYGGTGLGLAIVKRLCELKKGSIRVSSQPNHGSHFQLTLPLIFSSTNPLGIPTDLSESRILIVDDNANLRQILTRQLFQWGAQIWEANSGVAALTLLEKHRFAPFHTILIDLHMPEMDGLTLATAIKADPRFRNIDCVAMASFGNHNAYQLKQCGFDNTIAKPITKKALRKILAPPKKLNEPRLTPSKAANTPKNHRPENSVEDHFLLGKKLLLVEDNPVNQQVAQYFLDGFGCDIEIAANGISALSKLNASTRFDAVLMDCHMPTMDGFEASQRIRAGEGGKANQAIPIIAMTANVMPEDRQACLNAGMNDHIAKPITQESLKKMLVKWVPPSANIAELKSHKKSEKTTPSENNQSNEKSNLDISDKENLHEKAQISQLWQMQDALKRVRGKKERLRVLIELFLNDTPKRIESLVLAVHDNDTESAYQITHNLKGVVGNLSHPVLFQLSQELEKSFAKNTDKTRSKETVDNLLTAWQHQYHLFETHLRMYLENEKSQVA